MNQATRRLFTYLLLRLERKNSSERSWLCEQWLPEHIFDKIMSYSSSYMISKCQHIGISVPKHFTRSEMQHFFAIGLYIGIVRLPSKRDFWSRDAMMPIHKVANEMPRDRFDEMWKYLHLQGPSLNNDDNDD